MNQIIIYTICAEILVMVVYEIRRRLRDRRYSEKEAYRQKNLTKDCVIDDLKTIPRGTCGTYRMNYPTS
jgi:hypothetical protein